MSAIKLNSSERDGYVRRFSNEGYSYGKSEGLSRREAIKIDWRLKSIVLIKLNRKIKKFLKHAHPFTRYAYFCKFHVIVVAEWVELLKNHMICQIASTRLDDSNGAKIIVLCLPVQKLFQFLLKLWCVKHLLTTEAKSDKV